MEIFRELNKDVTTFMDLEPFPSLQALKEAVDRRHLKILHGKDLALRILLKTSNEFLGIATLMNITSGRPELGIWIKKSAHGHGYGREAIQGLTHWAQKNLQFEYLTYPVDKRNAKSIKIAESIGGILSKGYDLTIPSGKTLHVLEYRIKKELQ
jgi:RimJ/RimL family protein N-acetyltransferase